MKFSKMLEKIFTVILKPYYFCTELRTEIIENREFQIHVFVGPNGGFVVENEEYHDWVRASAPSKKLE